MLDDGRLITYHLSLSQLLSSQVSSGFHSSSIRFSPFYISLKRVVWGKCCILIGVPCPSWKFCPFCYIRAWCHLSTAAGIQKSCPRSQSVSELSSAPKVKSTGAQRSTGPRQSNFSSQDVEVGLSQEAALAVPFVCKDRNDVPFFDVFLRIEYRKMVYVKMSQQGG